MAFRARNEMRVMAMVFASAKSSDVLRRGSVVQQLSRAACALSRMPPQAACSDGDPNTENDRCDGTGRCAGTVIDCAFHSVPNEIALQGGECVVMNLSSSVACDDENVGTRNDRCNGSGGCAGDVITCPVSSACASYAPMEMTLT